MSSAISVVGASGLDIQSLVRTQVNAKAAQYETYTSQKKANAENGISGVGKLKSYLSSFKDTLGNFDKDNFNVSYKSKDDKDSSFSVKTTDDAQEQQFEFQVKQLAKSGKLTKEIQDQTFHSGTLTFDLGTDENGNQRQFNIDVSSGDNLKAVQKKFANNEFGVKSTLINKSTVNAGLGGFVFSLYSNNPDLYQTPIKITGSTKELQDIFGTENNTWAEEKGQDAIALVDGNEVHSKSNTFTNVNGVEITANKVSDDPETIKVEKDNDTLLENVKNVVTSFNKLSANLSSLTKGNTYTDGESNNDGGELANNASVRSMGKILKGTYVSSLFETDEKGKSLNDLGFSIDKYGSLTFDENKFNSTLKEDPKAIDLLTGENGLFTKLEKNVDAFLDDDGYVSGLQSTYNKQLEQVTSSEERYQNMLNKYSEQLTKRYTNMDNVISKYNSNLGIMQSILTTA